MTANEALRLAIELLQPQPIPNHEAHDEATRWADDGRSHE